MTAYAKRVVFTKGPLDEKNITSAGMKNESKGRAWLWGVGVGVVGGGGWWWLWWVVVEGGGEDQSSTGSDP